ncbi:MAG: HAD family hydrolase [Clostridia bacterium]|nr:HAD family hydrolase [Clostridia bacterium]
MPMQALFFDLDGTLLTSAKTIQASTRDALMACRNRGVKVFFATARSPRLDKMLGWTAQDFALFDGGIYCNGACEQCGDETRYAFIEPEAVRACLQETARFEGVHLSLHMAREVHAFNFKLPDDMLAPWGLKREEIAVIDEKAIQSATKILIFYQSLVDNTRPLPEVLLERIKARCGDLAKVYLTDQGCTIQVVSREAGKAIAIERVRERMGLSAAQVAVFGDDVNDVEMLSLYPSSVAMGNGAPEAKAAAAYITRSNDEDGIAFALRELLHIL